MDTLLGDVLKSDRYNSFSYKRNYSLNLLVSDYSQFSSREMQYAKNPNTHIDFLVFNKLDKFPVMAIEVDGYRFHELNEKQKERDELKDRILKYLGLPLSRFSTVGSGEKERLDKELSQIIEEIPESEDEKLKGNF